MAQEQELPPKRSLITRALSSRVMWVVGIFNVGFLLFHGLERFLEYSRFMSYIVNHWRELTRGLWGWLAGLIGLDAPVWALDLLTGAVAIILFTMRGVCYPIDLQDSLDRTVFTKHMIRAFERIFSLVLSLGEKDLLFPLYIILVILWIPLMFYGFLLDISRYTGDNPDFSHVRSVITLIQVGLIIAFALFVPFALSILWGAAVVLIIPLVIFLSIYVHVSFWPAIVIAILFSFIYAISTSCLMGWRFPTLIFTSELAIFVLIGLLALNYLALYSNAIEDFVEKATAS